MQIEICMTFELDFHHKHYFAQEDNLCSRRVSFGFVDFFFISTHWKMLKYYFLNEASADNFLWKSVTSSSCLFYLDFLIFLKFFLNYIFFSFSLNTHYVLSIKVRSFILLVPLKQLMLFEAVHCGKCGSLIW